MNLIALFDKRIGRDHIVPSISGLSWVISITVETVKEKLAGGLDELRSFHLGLNFASSCAPFPFVDGLFLQLWCYIIRGRLLGILRCLVLLII